jgi:hypothetical protein
VRTVVVLCAVAAVSAGVIWLIGPSIGDSHGRPPGLYIAVPGPWRWRWVPVLDPARGGPRYVHQRYRIIKYVGHGLPHHRSTLTKAVVAVPGPWYSRWVRVPHPAPGTSHYVRERYRSIRYAPAPEAPTHTP